MRINLTHTQANQLQSIPAEKRVFLAYNISHASSLSDNAFAFLIKMMKQKSTLISEVDFYFQEFHGDGALENYNNYVAAWRELRHCHLIDVADRTITFTGNRRFTFTCNAPEIKQQPDHYSSNQLSQSWCIMWDKTQEPFVSNQEDDWVLFPESRSQFQI